MAEKFFKSFLKKIETVLRNTSYILYRLFFRNKKTDVPLDINKINKILVLRYDKIGDMILTLPAIDFIKRLRPEIQIDILCSKHNYEIIKYDSRIDNKYISENKAFKLLKDALKLKKNKYDVVFSFVFYKTTLAGLISNFAGCKKTIKISILHREREKIYSAFYNIFVPSEDFIENKSMVEVLFFIANYVFGYDYDLKNIRQKIYVSEESFQKTTKFLNSIPKGKFIVLNLSAGHPMRTWALEKYVSLLELLLKEFKDLIFVLISTPKDYSKSIAVASNFSERVFCYGSNSILDAAALISRCNLVISPDTSIVHLSSVYSIPVLGLYSLYKTNLNNWTPFNVPNKILFVQNSKTINNILPESVFFAFKTFYSELFEDKQPENN